VVLMHESGVPSRNLNANAFDFLVATGWDLSLKRETCNGGLEARLLSMDGWNSATTAISGAASNIQINNVVPFFLPSVTMVNATYNSELTSGELNLRRPLGDRISLLAGLRYLELDEHLHVDLIDGGAPSTYDISARNRLYGGQLGAEATLWCHGRLTVEGLTKVGVFHNSGGQNSAVNTGAVLITVADTSNRAAFLGELAFTANYSLSDRLTFRAGYDLLWLETVALASDQMAVSSFATGNGISATGGAFYHGAFVGLEFQR
jgi:hypothetical protein